MFDSSTIAYGLNVQLYNNLGSSPRLYVVTGSDSPLNCVYSTALARWWQLTAMRPKGSKMFDVENSQAVKRIIYSDVRHAATDTRKNV